MSKIAIEEKAFRDVLSAEADKEVSDMTFEIILKCSRTLQRLAIKECNEPLSERDKKNDAKAEGWLEEVGIELGVKFTVDGDPRGYVVKLKTPKSKRYNTWGGEESGWGVPTGKY